MFDEVYMVAIGDDYERMVELTAPRVEHFLGIKPTILYQDDCRAGLVQFDAYTAKMHLLERGPMDGRIMLFLDADLVLMRSFDRRDFEPARFNAAPEKLWDESVAGYEAVSRAMWPTPVSKLLNTGLMAFPRTEGMRTMFRIARRLRNQMIRSGFQYMMGDELATNLALQSVGYRRAPVNILSRFYNWTTQNVNPEPGDARAVHLIGGAAGQDGEENTAHKLTRVKALCERFPV